MRLPVLTSLVLTTASLPASAGVILNTAESVGWARLFMTQGSSSVNRVSQAGLGQIAEAPRQALPGPDFIEGSSRVFTSYVGTEVNVSADAYVYMNAPSGAPASTLAMAEFQVIFEVTDTPSRVTSVGAAGFGYTTSPGVRQITTEIARTDTNATVHFQNMMNLPNERDLVLDVTLPPGRYRLRVKSESQGQVNQTGSDHFAAGIASLWQFRIQLDTPCRLTGDVNADGVVDFRDLNALLGVYANECGGN